MKKLFAALLLTLLAGLLSLSHYGVLQAHTSMHPDRVEQLEDTYSLQADLNLFSFIHVSDVQTSTQWIWETEESEQAFPEIDLPEETDDTESGVRHNFYQHDNGLFATDRVALSSVQKGRTHNGRPYRALVSRHYILHRAILI